MFGHTENIECGGHKYVIDSWCLGEDVYYVSPEGNLHYLSVHGQFMTAMDAIKIHAMNMNGYSP